MFDQTFVFCSSKGVECITPTNGSKMCFPMMDETRVSFSSIDTFVSPGASPNSLPSVHSVLEGNTFCTIKINSHL